MVSGMLAGIVLAVVREGNFDATGFTDQSSGERPFKGDCFPRLSPGGGLRSPIAG